ncbi:MAG: TlpA family protein disulfide reductase [Betaproteobacteria bacterium]|nr:TlpA family protein disulfide reductase [Betaproteobacteria bacterium]
MFLDRVAAGDGRWQWGEEAPGRSAEPPIVAGARDGRHRQRPDGRDDRLRVLFRRLRDPIDPRPLESAPAMPLLPAPFNPMLRLWFACLIFFFAGVAGTARAAVVEIGMPAPALAGTLISGERFDLADLRGKIVLVNFYSSYCKGCAYEIGMLETYRDEHQKEGFEVLMLGVDPVADKARVARMLGTYNLQGAMVDELDQCGFERRYPTPTAFVIDREGVVRDKLWGSKTLPRLRQLLAPYLTSTKPTQ